MTKRKQIGEHYVPKAISLYLDESLTVMDVETNRRLSENERVWKLWVDADKRGEECGWAEPEEYPHTFAETPTDDRRSPGRRIVVAPSVRLRALAEFVFSRRTFAGVFEPLLADLNYEWMEAHADGRPWKARWIRVRYTGVFLGHLFAQVPLGVMKALIALWKSAS